MVEIDTTVHGSKKNAIEDERQKYFLKAQSVLTNSPFEYIDMSVRTAYVIDWKDRVRAVSSGQMGLLTWSAKLPLHQVDKDGR